MQLTIGTDLVGVADFERQLEAPGTRFERVFSDGELRRAARYAGRRRAEHLAGRWAAKEAFLKAWAQAGYGSAPALAPEDLTWSEIEVQADAWGRVAIRVCGSVAAAIAASLGQWSASLSITHDAGYALATVLLRAQPRVS